MNRFFKSACISALILTSVNSQALTVVGHFDASVTTAEAAAFNTAAQIFNNTFTNNLTVNIDFAVEPASFASNPNWLAGSKQNSNYLNLFNYNAVASAMKNADSSLSLLSASSFNNAINNSSLSTTNPTYSHYILIGSAESRALGLAYGTTSAAQPDGYVYLNANDANAGYNLVALFEHEISEVLGRSSDLTLTTTSGLSGFVSPLDLLRYTSFGQLALTTSSSSPVYLSTNLGATQLVGVNQTASAGDLADFVNTHDAFNSSYAFNGASINLSTTDINLLNALGYTPVPEPETYSMLFIGLFVLLYQKRKIA